MSQNPYSPTVHTEEDIAAETRRVERSIQSIARTTFLAWEKLRIVYVFILGLVTVALAGTAAMKDTGLLRLIVSGALTANLLYFAGPAIETYIRWLGYNRAWPRWVMFICGTLLSIVLVAGVLATKLLPNQL